jgi:hypothetical protein
MSTTFGPELEKTGYFEAGYITLIKGLTKSDEKLKLLILLKLVKWNDYNGYSCNDGVKNKIKRVM